MRLSSSVEEKAAQEAAAEERRKEAAAMTLEEYQKKQAKEKAEELKAAREPEKLDMQGLKIKAEPDDVDEIRIGVSTQKKKEVKEKKVKEIFTDVNFTTPPIETASPSGGRGAYPLCPYIHIIPTFLSPSIPPNTSIHRFSQLRANATFIFARPP